MFAPSSGKTGPASTDMSLIRRLVREHRDLIVHAYPAALAFSLMTAAATGGIAALVARLVTDILVARDTSGLTLAGCMIGGLYVVRGTSGYVQARIVAGVGNRIIARCQGQLFEGVLGEGIHTLHGHDSAQTATRLTYSARSARQVLEQLFNGLLRDLFMLVGLLVVMVVHAPALAAVVVLSMPVVAGVSIWLSRLMRAAVNSEFLSIARIIAVAREAIAGARIVRAFGAQAMLRARARDAIERARVQADRQTAITARSAPIVDALGGACIVGIVLFAGAGIADNDYATGDMIAFMTALLMAYEPAKRLARLNVTISGGLAGLRTMYGFIDAAAPDRDPAGDPPARIDGGHVTLDRVSFAYEPARLVLRDVTFEARPGEITAIVGPSGSGKTTILSLIEGFVEAQSGIVAIDGQNIRSIRAGSLGGLVAIVTQDTFLFEGTVAENIACGLEGATRDDIVRAASAADAHGFIAAMPQGYDTPVGGDSPVLSAGQLQRVAIARALLRDPPVLLLDEVTAALDPVTESRVQTALNGLMAGRTTIVVAHRLALVREAHRIYLLEEGTIAASGTHAELLAMSETYRIFNRLQSAAQ